MTRTRHKSLPRADTRRTRSRALPYLEYAGQCLDGYRFTNAQLRGANFTKSSLRGAIFSGAVLDGASFEGADLTDCNFVRAHLVGTSLVGARLDGATFDETDLARACFRNVHGRKVSMWKTKIHCADFSGAQIAECKLDRADIQGASFARADLRKSSLRNARISNAEFTHALFSDADLSNAEICATDLSLVVMQRALARETIFDRVDFSGAICNGIDAVGAKFTRCQMRLAQFSDSNFEETRLIKCGIYGASFWNIRDARSVAQSLDLSHDSDESIVADDVKMAPVMFLVEEADYFVEIVQIMRLRSVLVLGADSGDNIYRLKDIQTALNELGLKAIVVKEQAGPASDSIMKKVQTLAALSRFVIVENSIASGHLFELPFIIDMQCVTAVLQEETRGATRMLDDFLPKYRFLGRFSYRRGLMKEAVLEAVAWAQDTLGRQEAERELSSPGLRTRRRREE